MSAREAAWRGRRTVETLVEDRLWRTVPAAWSRSWEPGLERILRDAPRAVPTGALLATDRLRAAASGSSQEEVGRMLESARLVRGGRLRLLGYPEAGGGAGGSASSVIGGRRSAGEPRAAPRSRVGSGRSSRRGGSTTAAPRPETRSGSGR